MQVLLVSGFCPRQAGGLLEAAQSLGASLQSCSHTSALLCMWLALLHSQSMTAFVLLSTAWYEQATIHHCEL